MMDKPCLFFRLVLGLISITPKVRASIPIAGIKVIISMIRQNVKNIPAIIVKLWDPDRGSCANTYVAAFSQRSGSLDVVMASVE